MAARRLNTRGRRCRCRSGRRPGPRIPARFGGRGCRRRPLDEQDTRRTRSSSAPAVSSSISKPQLVDSSPSGSPGPAADVFAGGVDTLCIQWAERRWMSHRPPAASPSRTNAGRAAMLSAPLSRRRSLPAPAMIAACASTIGRFLTAWWRGSRRAGRWCAAPCAASSTAWRRAGMSAPRPGRSHTWRRWPPRCSTSAPNPSAPSTSAPGSATAHC